MKYITVAAAIIINPQQQLLVVRKHQTACFMQVGGKLEPDESPEQSLLREIAEEIGCQATIEEFIGCYDTATANEPDCRLKSYLYWVSIDQSPQMNAEIAAMKWIDLDDQHTLLAPLTTEIVVPWVKQHLQQRGS